eukprot:TRINITY_DN7665_c0_g1_i2.p1 TRINITY_DN7665_c0_g1~~TRINITY_DN7665_c0_g1_i2.p1  ORF type:complete len:349 (+),score=75.19 TRINITY_DN7665_c0_g1_i2:299-1345(+)
MGISLVPCPRCGIKLLEDMVAVHLESCSAAPPLQQTAGGRGSESAPADRAIKYRCQCCQKLLPEDDAMQHVEICPEKDLVSLIAAIQLGASPAPTLDLLSRYLDNVLQSPQEPKFRKVKESNRAFQERIAPSRPALQIFALLGFSQLVEADGERYWVLPTDADLELLRLAREALAEALQSGRDPRLMLLRIDRDRQVFPTSAAVPQAATAAESVSFDLRPDELLHLTQAQREKNERARTLRTREQREQDARVEQKVYKTTTIRIRFPDGSLLQGRFEVQETLADLCAFVADALAQPGTEFWLLTNPERAKLSADSTTLLAAALVPAAVLNFATAPGTESKPPFLAQLS